MESRSSVECRCSLAIRPETVNATKKSHSIQPDVGAGGIEIEQLFNAHRRVACNLANCPQDAGHVFAACVCSAESPAAELLPAGTAAVQPLAQFGLDARGWDPVCFQIALQQRLFVRSSTGWTGPRLVHRYGAPLKFRPGVESLVKSSMRNCSMRR